MSETLLEKQQEIENIHTDEDATAHSILRSLQGVLFAMTEPADAAATAERGKQSKQIASSQKSVPSCFCPGKSCFIDLARIQGA